MIKVCIVDIFSNRSKQLVVNSYKRNTSHGKLIMDVFTSLCKNDEISISKYSVKNNSKNRFHFNPKSFCKQLKKINKSSERFDFVNISSSLPIPYEGINPEDLKNPSVKKSIYNKLPEKYKHIIDELQKLVDSHAKVYVPSGNRRNSFNLFSIVNGINVAGAKDVFTGEKIDYFTQNGAITNFQTLPILVPSKKMKKYSTEVVDLRRKIHNQSDIAKLSYRELSKMRATKKDYDELNNAFSKAIVDRGRKIGLNELQHSLDFWLHKKFQHKIYRVDKFKEIISNYLADGFSLPNADNNLYCDLFYRQFFDMNKKNKCVLPLKKFNTYTNSFSGTCLASVKAMTEAINKQK